MENSRYLLLSIISISLIGCGKSNHDFGEFNQYVFEYERQNNIYRNEEIDLDDLTIELVAIDSDTLGDCNYSKTHIRINSMYWSTTSDTGKELLIFHELGHCLNNMRHNDTEYMIMNTYGCSQSVTYSNGKRCLGDINYGQDRDYYIAKHFQSI